MMFETTPLEGLLIYKPKIFQDERGYFFESFNKKAFQAANITEDFVQDNRSYSIKGTLRGLHFQKAPFEQAKFVTVTRGEVYDVAVDIRPHSVTFGQSFGILLSEKEPRYLYIPRGFAHGFLTVSESADFFYKVDNIYNKESEGGLSYNDPSLEIDWPQLDRPFIISEKDRILPSLQDFKNTWDLPKK
jgi:dTDP-4-dehydrorhamnose 3,5-epimerase